MEKTVDAREILFIRRNAPHGFPSMIAENLGLPKLKVRNELNRLKDEYDMDIVNEARRILKAVKGLEYGKEEA